MEIANICDEAAKKLEQLHWPKRTDEEWRRSDTSLIPFDKLESHNIDLREREINSYLALEDVLKTSISTHKGVDFYLWSDEKSRIAAPVLSNQLEYALDKVDVWRVSQLRYGGVIVVEKDTKITDPIIVSLDGGDEEDVLAPLIVVIVEDNASFLLGIEIKGTAFFSLGCYGIVGKNANLHVNELQNASLDSFVINTMYVDCEEKAEFTSTSGQLGGMMAVDRVHVSALGTESHLHLNGYYFPIEDQLVDMRTYQRHVAVDSNSRSLYHGVAVGQSHSIYRGLIEVGVQAVETDAYLTNKNLLLSEDARMDSIPCLNINTNEVRCSHGSTTGTIDPEQIYYLQTRGLSETDAKELLLKGFFQVVYDQYFEQMNETTRAIIRDRIHNNL